ncbi:hypothetical protein [Candidatus Nitrosocosmicus sp. R]
MDEDNSGHTTYQWTQPFELPLHFLLYSHVQSYTALPISFIFKGGVVYQNS